MIEMKNIIKEFSLGGETIKAVDNATFSISSGEFVAITGPSGSGKSTLMNIIGLLDKADSGTYLLDGMDVTDLTDDEQSVIRNRKIGFVFQSFYLLQKLTALENVMIPLLYRGLSEREAASRAMNMLEKLKLADRYKHLPNQLSGGQQQRVPIARALAGEPSLILADEPTGALDQSTGRDILELLQELNDSGQTIVMITHDLSIASGAGRIIRIEDGKLKESEEAANESFIDHKDRT